MAKPDSVSPARRAAFEILRRVEDGAFASVLLASKEENLSPADRALTHELELALRLSFALSFLFVVFFLALFSLAVDDSFEF